LDLEWTHLCAILGSRSFSMAFEYLIMDYYISWEMTRTSQQECRGILELLK